MDIILNQIAIWKKSGAKKLNIRKSPTGQQYREKDSVVYKIATTPLIRYMKDYKIGKVEYSLFLRTDCEDVNKVELALDSFAKQITKEYALQATANATASIFEYTPYVFDPSQLIIKEDK